MKRIIKETLNEKVFVEIYAETDTNGKMWYCVTVLFRYTHEAHTGRYKCYNKALTIYNILKE